MTTVRIATEAELEEVFADCEPGALPPFGRLYGLTTILDASLSGGAEIVFVGQHPTRGSPDAVPRLRGDRGPDQGPVRVPDRHPSAEEPSQGGVSEDRWAMIDGT